MTMKGLSNCCKDAIIKEGIWWCLRRDDMTGSYLTLREVADKYGVEQHQVRYAIRAGYLKAEKKGWMLLIKRKSLPKKWPVGGD